MISVRVPATSANLGPGFDCLGIALGLYNRFDIELSDSLVLRGCAPAHAGDDNLFLRACRFGFETAGRPFPDIAVRFATEVPVARGLGSSATCIVAGLLAADALMGGNVLGRETVLDLAARMEGHPDNVAPALLGGFAVSVLEAGKVRAIRGPIGSDIRFKALIPDFELETSVARAVLPSALPFRDAVFNSGRAALMTAAFLTRDWESLGFACEDRLHERYRAPLIPGFEAIVRHCRDSGALAVFLSGAGPTIMAVTRSSSGGFDASTREFLATRSAPAWTLVSLAADDSGATVGESDEARCL